MEGGLLVLPNVATIQPDSSLRRWVAASRYLLARYRAHPTSSIFVLPEVNITFEHIEQYEDAVCVLSIAPLYAAHEITPNQKGLRRVLWDWLWGEKTRTLRIFPELVDKLIAQSKPFNVVMVADQTALFLCAADIERSSSADKTIALHRPHGIYNGGQVSFRYGPRN